MARKNRKIDISINRVWCKQCGICIEFCPEDVYESRDGAPHITEIDKCTGCLKCEIMCPDFAITVNITKTNVE